MFQHGRHTVILLNNKDISVYCTTSQLEKNADKHDVTTYGKDAHVYSGGLTDGGMSISGIYDNSAVAGPRAVIDPLVGQVVEVVRRPEGAGNGKPEDTFDVLVEKYVETSPVADMVTWSVDLQPSDTIDSTPQGS